MHPHVYNRYANMKFDVPFAEPVKAPVGVGENLGTPYDLKAQLLEEARGLGVPAKGTWGIEKLRRAIGEYNSAQYY